MTFVGRRTIQVHFEANRPTVFRRAQHQMQVATVEPETILAGTVWSTALSGPTFHHPLSPHWFKAGFDGGL